MPTLVVIDMQTGFGSANHRPTIDAVIEEIQSAIRNKWAIVLVEYVGFGTTLPEILKEAKKSPMLTRVDKENDDGAWEVFKTVTDWGYDYWTLRICGVNANMCVRDTVTGLVKLLPETNIAIVDRACHSYMEFDWFWTEKLPTIQVEYAGKSIRENRALTSFSYFTNRSHISYEKSYA